MSHLCCTKTNEYTKEFMWWILGYFNTCDMSHKVIIENLMPKRKCFSIPKFSLRKSIHFL